MVAGLPSMCATIPSGPSVLGHPSADDSAVLRPVGLHLGHVLARGTVGEDADHRDAGLVRLDDGRAHGGGVDGVVGEDVDAGGNIGLHGLGLLFAAVGAGGEDLDVAELLRPGARTDVEIENRLVGQLRQDEPDSKRLRLRCPDPSAATETMAPSATQQSVCSWS